MGFFLKFRTTSRLNSLLKPSDLQKVIHAFLHLEMSDVNALYIGVSQSFPSYTISPITVARLRKRTIQQPCTGSLGMTESSVNWYSLNLKPLNVFHVHVVDNL